MAEYKLGDGIKKVFLVGIGAMATGAEKADQIVNDLVAKGELTVEQGKALNEELKRKAKEEKKSGADDALRTKLEAMTPEERAAYAAKVAEMAAQIDGEPDSIE